MKIGGADKNSSRKNRKGALSRRNILVLILLLLLGSMAYYGSGKARMYGYSGLWDMVSVTVSNYWKGRKAEIETVSIEIKEKDLKVLKNNRKNALERGLIINDLDGDYVPATLDYEGKRTRVKLRLKGHMTDHLQEDKWSFRVRIKNKETFMGMSLFTLQHPGTRGYINEWIYHQLMKKEDIIALRYKFIHVMVNGKDWGIYALEENFENELLENNARLKGPILRFDPDLYWINRYNVLNGQASFDEFSSYYSANPVAYREEKILADSVQRALYLKAIALIEGVRERKIPVHKAFDIKRMARFHALIDLVGGQHSIDWSDIKYYYNPVNGLLEPVAYESFTSFPVSHISGNYKFVQPDPLGNFEDWHSALFSDTVFFRSYVEELERICQPVFLDSFFSSLGEELEKNLAILYREFPYKKFSRENYYSNQKRILRILDTPKAIHAYLASANDSLLSIQLACIESLPVEINAVSVNGSLSERTAYLLPSKQPQTYLKYTVYKFRMPQGFRWKKEFADSLKVRYRIPGSTMLKEVRVFPYQHTDADHLEQELKMKEPNAEKAGFLVPVPGKEKALMFRSGKTVIEHDLIVAPGTRLVAYPGTVIDLRSKARIISYSPIGFYGEEDLPVSVISSDSSSGGIHLLNAGIRSSLKHVIFNGSAYRSDSNTGDPMLSFYESDADISGCSFGNLRSPAGIRFIRSEFRIRDCLFRNMQTAIAAEYAAGEIIKSVVEDCQRSGIRTKGSDIRMKTVVISGIKGLALDLRTGSRISGNNVQIRDAFAGLSCRDFSSVNLTELRIDQSSIGVAAYQDKKGSGHPSVTISLLSFRDVKNEFLREKDCRITADGKEIEEEAENVKDLISNGKKVE